MTSTRPGETGPIVAEPGVTKVSSSAHPPSCLPLCTGPSTLVLSFTASGDVGPYRLQIAQGRLPEPGSLGAADVLSSFMSASPIPWFAPPETVSPPLAMSTRRRRGEDA
jgi:hypothetical protein